MDRIEFCTKTFASALSHRLFRIEGNRNPRFGHFAVRSSSREVPMGVGSLVLHGLSSVLATGVFVVTVHVAHEIPGPSMISALVIAAVSCFLSGLCYAELEAKVNAGSKPRNDAEEPYVDSELTHQLIAKFAGEFAAFVASWVLVLYHLATLAISARIIGAALVFVAGGPSPSACSVEILAVVVVAFVVTVGALSLAASDARSTAACGLAVVATIAFLLVGFPSIDARNWAAHSYLTHGSSGLLSGAAVCTTAFFCHPAIGVHGRRCRRSIPLAAGLTLTVCFLTYLSVATILTLTTVREEPNADLHMPQTAHGDSHWTQSMLAILEIPCLGVALLGTVQSLKGCMTSLAADHLVCRCFGGKSGPRWVVPFAAGTLTSVLVFVARTPTMLQLMAVSPLFSNTLACLCVLHARYQPNEESAEDELFTYRPLLPVKAMSGEKPVITINRRRLFPLVSSESLEKRRSRSLEAQVEYEAVESVLLDDDDEYGETDEDDDNNDDDDSENDVEDTDTDIDAVFTEYVQKLKVATSGDFHATATQLPSCDSGRRATICVGALFASGCCIAVLLVTGRPGPLSAVPIALLTVVVVSLLVVIARIPQSQLSDRDQDGEGPFRVPLVPWQPAIAVFVSTCLAVDTLMLCWLPFALWAAIGVVAYASCTLARERDVPRPRVERICLPLLTPPPHALVASLLPVHRESMEQMDKLLIAR